MTNIKTQENISVLNYGHSLVVISTKDRQYTFNPISDDGIPSMIPLSYKEIEFVNSNSSVFRNGTLRFKEDKQEEIYEALRIVDWSDILFEDVIIDTISNPTLEKLQKIINVKTVAVIERVRGILVYLKNTGEADVSIKVDRIINERFKEISHGQLKSNIVLRPKDTEIPVAAEDINDLKSKNAEIEAQNAEMAKRLADMEALVAKLAEDKEKEKTPEPPEKPTETTTAKSETK